jgi:hypothetical protein
MIVDEARKLVIITPPHTGSRKSVEVRTPLPPHRAHWHFLPSLVFGCSRDGWWDTDHFSRLETLENAALLGWEIEVGRLEVAVDNGGAADHERYRLVQFLAIDGVHEERTGLDLNALGPNTLDG